MSQKESVQHIEAGSLPPVKETINKRLALINLYAAGGAVAYGFSTAIIGSSLGQPQLSEYFDLATRSNAAGIIGAIAGLHPVGGFFGVFLCSWICERWGRKAGMHMCELAMLLGTGLSAGATSVEMLILGRFFNGFASWPFCMVAVLYAQEMAPATRRGTLGGCVGVAISVGYIIASWTGVGFFFYNAVNNWRVPLALQAVMPIITFAASFIVPESPRWLASVDRAEESLKVLEWIHYDAEDPDHLLPREEHYQIVKQVALDKTLPSSWASMFGRYKRRTGIAILVAVAAQATGVQIITNYGPRLYAALGYDAQQTLLVAAAWQSFGIVVNLTAALVVDRVGRRFPLIIAATGCAVCMAVEAGTVSLYLKSPENLGAAKGSIAAFFIFIFFYQFGEPVQYVYFGEIFPTNVRPKGVAISIACICLMGTWITEATPSASEKMKYGYYIFFAILATVGAIAQYFWLPETKGIPLEEMAEVFGDAEAVAVHQSEVHAQLAKMGFADREVEKDSAPGSTY